MVLKNSINWRYVAEFIALLSVVLSLLFVGYEIRQNSMVARMNAYQNYQSSVLELAIVTATDPIITPLLVRTQDGEGLNDFTNEERSRLVNYFMAGVRTYEDLYRSVQAEVIPMDALRNVGAGITGMNTLAFKEMWDSIARNRVDLEFANWFETQIPSLQH